MDIQGAQNRLLRTVLSWDYFELSKRLEEDAIRKLQTVPDTFSSIEHYQSVFEPLILEECCGGIVRGSIEGETPDCHESMIANRKSDGEWVYARITLGKGVSEEFKKGDLIILSRDHPDNSKARSEFHALGFVESREAGQSIGVRFYFNLAAQAGMESQENRVKIMDKELIQHSGWWLCSLGSISTIVREWIALQHIQFIPFKNLLLTGEDKVPKTKKALELSQAMQSKIEAQYNESQVAALHAGLDGTPVILIQGPPGTGKTYAILGLLSVILHCSSSNEDLDSMDIADEYTEISSEEKFALWARQSPWIVGLPCRRDEMVPTWDSDDENDPNGDCYGLLDYDTPIPIGKQIVERPRVLVCAPSNSALDEIMHRILSSGLMGRNGSIYHPTVVRVGVNPHHSVQTISIDHLIGQKLSQQENTATNTSDRDKIRGELLEEADIVGSTLGYSGSTIFQRLNRKFDVIVIDEAAQAVEPSTLVPLINGAKQVFLVGDPNQLPATVLSARASEYNYSKSLFKRLMNAGYPVYMMNVQYRMHPAISWFPSSEFYGGKLLDAPSVVEETKCSWHQEPCFGPLAFYHVLGNEFIPEKTTSIANREEAEFIVLLYRELIQKHPEIQSKPCVAVITPYSAQVKLIKSMMKDVFGQQVLNVVDVNSIDGFQGRQKDIAFYSTVRSTEKKKIGFVADDHRLNVGLTRARCSMIIVGNAKSLMRDKRWARLVLSAKVSNCLYNPTKPFGDYVAALGKREILPIPPTAMEAEFAGKLKNKEIKDESPASCLTLPSDEEMTDRGDIYTQRGSARKRGKRGKRATRRRRRRGG